MADNKHSENGVANRPSDEELREQLQRSRELRKQANERVDKADNTVSEMSKILRRIAEAMDRNPQNWDALFNGKQRQ